MTKDFIIENAKKYNSHPFAQKAYVAGFQACCNIIRKEFQYYIDWKFLYYIKHCLENHFDIAGLIEKGQAVDVNTLKVNPYKKK